MFGKFLLISLVMILGACAKPRYQDVKGDQGLGSEFKLYLNKTGLAMDVSWEKIPTESETGSFLIFIYGKENPEALLPLHLNLTVELWMPSMGHGSSPVTVEKVSNKYFRAREVFFIMPGEWEIRFQLKDGSHVIEETTQKITI